MAAAQVLVREGLATGTAGNVSVRDGDTMWITPSAVAPQSMVAEDVVALDALGVPRTGGGVRPSSEWQFHRAVLQARPDVGAIVHTHSPWATAVSCTGRVIPPFHYMMVGTGDGTLRCAPYDPPGSAALADGVVRALGARRACLLAHHGVVAVGSDLDGALDMAREVETLAQQYAIARMVGGPEILGTEEVATLVEIFSAYGDKSPGTVS